MLSALTKIMRMSIPSFPKSFCLPLGKRDRKDPDKDGFAHYLLFITELPYDQIQHPKVIQQGYTDGTLPSVCIIWISGR